MLVTCEMIVCAGRQSHRFAINRVVEHVTARTDQTSYNKISYM